MNGLWYDFFWDSCEEYRNKANYIDILPFIIHLRYYIYTCRLAYILQVLCIVNTMDFCISSKIVGSLSKGLIKADFYYIIKSSSTAYSTYIPKEKSSALLPLRVETEPKHRRQYRASITHRPGKKTAMIVYLIRTSHVILASFPAVPPPPFFLLPPRLHIFQSHSLCCIVASPVVSSPPTLSPKQRG